MSEYTKLEPGLKFLWDGQWVRVVRKGYKEYWTEAMKDDPYWLVEVGVRRFRFYNDYVLTKRTEAELVKKVGDKLSKSHTPKNMNKPEPEPQRNDKPAVWDLVIRDMKQRDQEGRAKYGTPLQPFNGRNVLVDAYQEALDLAVYLRQAIFEKHGE